MLTGFIFLDYALIYFERVAPDTPDGNLSVHCLGYSIHKNQQYILKNTLRILLPSGLPVARNIRHEV